MKHKHADLIKAWADGAKIQEYKIHLDEWRDISPYPVWDEQLVYRIKPEPRWFGLTGSEVRQLKDIHIPIYSIPKTEDWFNFYRAIENELKDRNTTG
jgi:hypothetical protein